MKPRVMDPKPDRAAREAGRTYSRAITEHFREAHRLLLAGEPDAAERIAITAARLRWLAASEVVVR